MKSIFYYFLYLIAAILILPYIVSSVLTADEAIYSFYGENPEPELLDYPAGFNFETVDGGALEEYLIGVVAAEMPALYNEEALKAQAVCSRTYAYRFISNNNQAEFTDISQAYLSISEMQDRWGEYFQQYFNKIKKAVNETENEIIVYDGEAIEAVFHATSGGITESSENVWQQSRPYLVSVDSDFDREAEGYLSKTVFTWDELQEKLSPLTEDGTWSIYRDGIYINEVSEAGYVINLKLGDNIVSGSDFRFALGLRSSNFDLETDQNEMIIAVTVRGYGHGAGMSQTGANYLAAQGYDYKNIIYYYYNDVTIDKINVEPDY